MSTREPTPFAILLLRYRAAAHLTQEQLGTRAGLSSDTIAALECGKRRMPRATTVERLAEALGLEASERAHLAAAVQASAGVPRGRPASVGPDGVKDGGALRDTHRRPWWLTMEPTPLVGRAHELDTIVRTLLAEDTRLLTLTGPAGVGKTRLALAAAVRLVEDGDRCPDGIARVDLTPVRDPDLVLGAIARALGLLDVGGRPVLESLVETLAGRRRTHRPRLAWRQPHSRQHLHPPAHHDTLMVIDIVNAGWAPIYLSNLTEDIPGYIEAPAQALAYSWQ
ncbi:MAG TPA: helix-turn-helix domain-containing protein, partial [Anaerolineae bacterium]